MDKTLREKICQILEEELVPAMGCTEPIALALAAAKARVLLGTVPEHITAWCSGNMIKNVRCVFIPNSGGMTGIETACLMGAIGGDAGREMEVLESVGADALAEVKRLLQEHACEVRFLDSEIPLHFIIEVQADGHNAAVEVRDDHTNVFRVLKDGVCIYQNDAAGKEDGHTDRGILNLEVIKEYADTVPLAEIRELFERQIRCNLAIAEEGMKGTYGIGIGPILDASYPDDIYTRMKAYAAAASEARMGGCDMPVIINSGSGNQGIAASVPLIIYAREKKLDSEQLIRALVFSALLTIYQKEYIGKLSAFCGAVSATCSSGAALTYLVGGSLETIKRTIDNTLAITPGILCDGAKISCAAKIQSGFDAAVLAHKMAMLGRNYEANTGILMNTTDETINAVGYIGKFGMRQTDKEIIQSILRERKDG